MTDGGIIRQVTNNICISLVYAQLNSRRPIARAANTGISCFINTRGDIRMKTKYNEAVAISDTVQIETKKTFYSRQGDYISRVALVLAIGFLLVFVRQRLMPKK